ncbi:HORMA domain [Trypanosoma vivax]|uniref:Putative mitotic spindle checkpoint component n=1 Tax=Trypanosoma vivax (strain Y486) TaxID=1055687 RepID=G0TSI7_TRYVY|nr:putative mitotic spindle checkpoint component [Trypanosoma vivax]KAH8605556.1 HORMA domain [Trypanosoma vivax]CCC46914.1 putative mitotic spindle checkpoint component, fragment [Trypanosoma vivax Y486]
MSSAEQCLTFRSSVSTVAELLGFAIYSILYQRGVFPCESFSQVTRYGMPLMVSSDAELNSYLSEVLGQVAAWINTDKMRKVVVIIAKSDDNEVIERWVFDITTEENVGCGPAVKEEEVRGEIQALLRQITSSVSCLPLITQPCHFDTLVYTDLDTEMPAGSWEASNPRLILDSSEVRLRSFSTSFHGVAASVAYKNQRV